METTIQQTIQIDGRFMAYTADREERLGNAAHSMLEAAGKALGFDFNRITSAEEFGGEPWTHIGLYADLENGPAVKHSFRISDLTADTWPGAIAGAFQALFVKVGKAVGFAVTSAEFTRTAESVTITIKVESNRIRANGVQFTGDPDRIAEVTAEAEAGGIVVLDDNATATREADGSVTIDLPKKA